MKLSELIAFATSALENNGDIDVCIPVEGDGIYEEVGAAELAIVRQFGDPRIGEKHWSNEDKRDVFVIS